MDKQYATFWLRVSAFILDGIVLAVLDRFLIKNFYFNLYQEVIFDILICWLYFATFHSSKWKATLGKKVAGIEVVDYDYNQITFKKASYRYMTSMISATLIFPYLTVFLHKKIIKTLCPK